MEGRPQMAQMAQMHERGWQPQMAQMAQMSGRGW
jgi:hypothetical protein